MSLPNQQRLIDLAIHREPRGSRKQFDLLLEDIPVDGIILKKLKEILLETGPNGEKRVVEHSCGG